MKVYYLLSLIVLVGAVSFMFGATFFSPTQVATLSENEGSNSITYHAVQCAYIQRAGSSEWQLWDCNENLFNNDGMNLTRDLLSFYEGGGAGWRPVDVIALANITHEPSGAPGCNNTQGADNQSLCGEYVHGGLSRAIADAVRWNQTAGASNPAGNWTIMRQFTNTGSAQLDVNGTGLFNSTTANDSREVFFAQNTFTTAALQVNDKINVTWYIWVT